MPRGLVAERPHLIAGASEPLAAAKDALALLAQALHARPQFIAYSVSDLPATLPTVARKVLGLPLLTWTVRSADQRRTRRALCRPDDLRGISAINLHYVSTMIAEPMIEITLRVANAISDVAAEAWDACANPAGSRQGNGGAHLAPTTAKISTLEERIQSIHFT